jgi:type 1 glutamine amidotransferase
MKSKAIICVSFLAIVSLQLISNTWAVEPPEPRSRSEVEAVLAKAPKPPARTELGRLNVVLVAFKKDHGENEHDYPLWQKRWAVLLGGRKAGQAKQVNLYGPPPQGRKGLAGAPKVNVSTAHGWPSDEQFEKADLIAFFCYVQWDREKLARAKRYLDGGGGMVIMHPAVIAPKEKDLDDELAELIGLAWKQGQTRWRHGRMDLKIAAPDHPICAGLPATIRVLDEPYWPLTGDLGKVTVLVTSDETISKNSEETRPEPMFYIREHGKGRVFTCILGHYTWTFDDPYFRILLLRGMAWAAGESPYRFDPLVKRGIELAE